MKFSKPEVVLICAFRYALGRATYMPSLIVDEIKHNWPQITEGGRRQIVEDVERAIAADPDCAKEMWGEFIQWAEIQEFGGAIDG